MNTAYHVIIAVENRKGDRVSPFVYTSKDGRTQIHNQGWSIADIDNPNLVYVSAWDQTSPYITVLKGSKVDINMEFGGWQLPEKSEWDAQKKAQEEAAQLAMDQEVANV